MIAVCGGRNVKFMTTLLLVLPALGTGLALQNPQTPFFTFVVLASLCGIGGGAFLLRGSAGGIGVLGAAPGPAGLSPEPKAAKRTPRPAPTRQW